jgi:serine/threonine protein kinase
VLGETIGGFQITGALAQGAAGELYAARGADGEAALLRLYPADLCHEPPAVQRCLDDARAAGGVGAIGIARTIATGMHGDRAYVAFEAGDGDAMTLDTHIREAGRMSATQVATIARQLADALAAAHARGLVHRDLRPSRIVFETREDGRELVRVLDFGSARLEASPKTVDGAIYAAPERFAAGAMVTPGADIYALGCIAYDMACGQPPFHGTTIDELRAKHLTEPPPSARATRPDVPPGLEYAIVQLLQKSPGERPKSIADVARTFEVLGGGALDAAPLAPTGSHEILSASILHASASPPSPPELYARQGEIGNAREMTSLPPSTSGTVKISNSLAGHVIPPDDALPPGSTLSARMPAAKGSPMTMLLIVGIAVAVLLAVAIYALV